MTGALAPTVKLPVLAVLSAVWSRLGIYIVLVLAARNLPNDEFGVFAVLMAVAGIVNAMVSGGGDMWLSRFTWRSATQAKRAGHSPRSTASCESIASMVSAPPQAKAPSRSDWISTPRRSSPLGNTSTKSDSV